MVETVNEEIRVYDKTTAPSSTMSRSRRSSGKATAATSYVVYDDIANRWYVTALDGSDTGLLLAVSNDSNSLDGFLPTYNLDVNGGAGLPDYPKPGFNKDAIFVDFNDFAATGNATIATINKADALRGHAAACSSRSPELRVPGDAPGPDARRHDGRSRVVLLDRRQRRQRRHHACHRDDQLLQQQPDVHVLRRSRLRRIRRRSTADPARRHLDHVPEHDDLLRSST